jgi:MFS family permease
VATIDRRAGAHAARHPLPAVPGPAGVRPATRRLAAFEAPCFGRLWAAGGLWNITRWMTIFLSSYLVNRLTGSPLLVQLVGTSFFLPMFIGGLAAGVISDRFDRRRTVVRQLLGLIPCAAVMSVLVTTDVVQVWMLYVFAIAVGIGQVVDMTNRRALVHDIVGDDVFANAMAIEAFSMAAGNMLGSLTGGTVIDLLGEGSAYGLVALFYVVCFGLMRGVPPVARRDGAAASRQTDLRAVRDDLAEGVRALPSNRPFVSVLGVTVAMNFLFFPFMPMIPVLAKSFDVGPLLTGVLASGYGAGMLLGALGMVVFNPVRRGLVYVGGSFLGMGFLTVFALMDHFLVALGALVLTGICSAGFASVQSALVMSVSPVEMRGRAMGLLSMAIGSLPFGMLLLGLLAEQVGPHTAVIICASAGSVGLLLWLLRRPEVLRIT